MVLSIFLTFSNTVKLKPAGKPQLFDFEPTTYGDTRVLLNDSTPEGVDTLFLKLTSPVCVCVWVGVKLLTHARFSQLPKETQGVEAHPLK